ncbi:Dipeptide transport system permease protein DppB [Acaryochloris thomasi RCC1774]|uniref:Dipeptide transport system permease protein DppB n=1 Tax=Acaryochloris thomasi RCC1774 TaxID=1764569 RepID=A0A2W1JPG9_9CYAN|nr:ABC transporter permease [Acaryochloris thomasi]PZD72782.1 Dipeptide transport system permease protein DppB [Acaryochloris thomasi RCC1774]
MQRYLIQRLLSLCAVLFGITLLVFLFLHYLPGGPAQAILGERASPEQVAALQVQLGLDQPLPQQYLALLRRLARFDFGRSIISGVPVRQEIFARWPATFELAAAALLIALLLGIPAGILAAVRQHRWLDKLTLGASLLGVSMPVYWLGLLLKYLFSVNLGWLPPSGRLGIGIGHSLTGFYLLDAIVQLDGEMLLSALVHLLLPALTLSSIPLAIVARITRSAMLGTLSQDFMRTARAKGVPEAGVVLTHGLKNALLPVMTIVGLQFGTLLGGAILTETIFAWPGLGLWIYEGILDRDYPIVLGGVIFVAVTYTVINLLVDLSYAFLDPRIQYK